MAATEKLGRTRMRGVYRTQSGSYKVTWRTPAHRQKSAHVERLETAGQLRAYVVTLKRLGRYPETASGREILAQWRDAEHRDTHEIVDLETTLDDFWPRIEASPDLRPATRNLYQGLARNYLLPAFGSRRLSLITSLDVEQFIAKMLAGGFGGHPGPATVNAAYRL